MRKIGQIFSFLIPVIAFTVLFGFMAGCGKARTEKNKALLQRLYEEGFNQGNLDVMDELIAEDFVHYTAGKVDVKRPEGFKGLIGMFRTAFPDLVFTVEDMIAEGNKVTSRQTYTGTHQGDLMGIAPTGAKVRLTGICIFRIADGRIAEGRTEFDQLGMLQQLGVVPAMGRKDFTWGEPSEATGDPGDPEANKAIFQPVVDEVWNKGNLAPVDEIFGADYVLHDPAFPEDIRGPAGFKQYVTAMAIPFPDQHAAVEDIVAEGDKIAVRWTYAGTHQDELMGIPATGKQVMITGTTIHRFADGKIVESWFSYDMLGLLQQLGVIPLVEQGGE